MKYVYGLNISGQSIIDYFITKQISFFAWDDSVLKRNEIQRKYKKIILVPPNDLDWLKISEVYVSPGINLNCASFIKLEPYNL